MEVERPVKGINRPVLATPTFQRRVNESTEDFFARIDNEIADTVLETRIQETQEVLWAYCMHFESGQFSIVKFYVEKSGIYFISRIVFTCYLSMIILCHILVFLFVSRLI